MDYEEKYKEALERARALRNEAIEKEYAVDYIKDYETIFPELCDSEDEMIRGSLIKFFTTIKEISESGRTTWAVRKEDAEMCKSFIAYLKKQKEQKSALTPKRIFPKFAIGDTVCRPMWSDHTIREIYVDNYEPTYICVNEEGVESHIPFSEQNKWTKKEKKPAEWSEEDIHRLRQILAVLDRSQYYILADWVKTLLYGNK